MNAQGQERQHFLLSAGAVTLSEKHIARMTDEEAYAALEAIRFSDQGGVPFCPDCDTPDAYRLLINRQTKAGPTTRRLYKCSACRKQFSVTSGTALASRKLPIRDLLYAMMVFVNAASGEAALRLRRAVDYSYKGAFVCSAKLREAVAFSRDKRKLGGVVEVDGTSIGGTARKATLKQKAQARKDAKDKQEGKFRSPRADKPSPKWAILALRERHHNGMTRTAVFDHELHYRDGTRDGDFIRNNVARGSTLVSDEGFELGYIGVHKTVKHADGYMIEGIHTNGVEGFFSRVKRSVHGVYYGVTKPYGDLYAEEAAWREDHRRKSTGELFYLLVHAMTHAPVSRRLSGYWSRSRADTQPKGQPRRNRAPLGKKRPGNATTTLPI